MILSRNLGAFFIPAESNQEVIELKACGESIQSPTSWDTEAQALVPAHLIDHSSQ